ncbi:MAG: hypothetical protein Q9173_003117 [Seirophora scorigena]
MLALFGRGLYCRPGSSSLRSLPLGGSLSSPNSTSSGQLGDEFSGLTLHCDKERTTRNRFSVEDLAIATISAMKEEALKDYNAAIYDFYYTATRPQYDPIRIALRPAQGAAAIMLKRSSVMWTIKALSKDLMRTRFLHPLLFSVQCDAGSLFGGILEQSSGPAASAEPTGAPLSLVLLPKTSTDVVRAKPESLQDQPHYQVNLNFVGERLSQYYIFVSLLTALLQLGRSDVASILREFAMDNISLPVWVFMNVIPHPDAYPFQQYHAVALLEAAAQYYVLHHQYTEMTFELLMNGRLTASGCVTKALISRRRCFFGVEVKRNKTVDLVASA